MKIGVVGLGLIGASLGWELKNKGHTIIGISRRQSTCDQALATEIVSFASLDLADLKGCKVVILATPIAAVIPTLKNAIPYLDAYCLVTDVASVKEQIVTEASQLWPQFIGGHPMAGTARKGIEAAQLDLFKNAVYVLTPTDETNPKDQQILSQLLTPLGVQLLTCSPAEHDLAVAWISHLPVITSTALIQSSVQENNDTIRQLAELLASSGFRDTSRVGGGNPELGRMMAEYNRKALLTSLQGYRQQLDQLIVLITEQKWPELETQLTRNAEGRKQFVPES